MKWQKSLLTMLQNQEGKNIALAIDTSTDEVDQTLVDNIIKLFEQVYPSTMLIQADFKIREISPIQKNTITYYKHGKSSYTDVLEWGTEHNVDILYYVTDVTGYFYEKLEIKYDVMWLVPNSFIPKVPFGKTMKIS